jgi:hypothetical protein
VSGSHPAVLPRNRPWQTIVLLALGSIVIVGYASLGRPLWIDEFLQFALGALPLDTALRVIYETTEGVNHGQTGVYMLTDVLLLKLGGANLFLMRLPSLVCGALLLASGVYFLRLKSLGFLWQALLIAAFGAQSVLMYYAGDARPYIVLVATTVAMLAYYETPSSMRRTWLPRLIGAFGILVGSISHPYFLLFLPVVLLFAGWDQWHEGNLAVSRRALVAFVNPHFVLPALVLYVCVGLVTWLKGSPDFRFDPWEPFGGDAISVVRSLTSAHFGFFVPQASYVPYILAGLIVLLLAFPLLALVSFGGRALAAPLVLAAMGLLTTAMVTVASVVRAYWVFDRQWVVGMAFTTLGTVWLLGRLWTLANTKGSTVWRLVVLALVAVILANATLALTANLASSREDLANWRAADPGVGLPSLAEVAAYDNDTWVQLGNLAAQRGGPIPPEVGWYYIRPEAP